MASHIERVAAGIRAVADGSSGHLEVFHDAAEKAKKLEALAAQEPDARSLASALASAGRSARGAAGSLERYRRGGEDFANSLVAHGRHAGLSPLQRARLTVQVLLTVATTPFGPAAQRPDVTFQNPVEAAFVDTMAKVHDAVIEDGEARKKGWKIAEETDVVQPQETSLDVDPDDVRRGGQG